jgi:hypothetical protein
VKPSGLLVLFVLLIVSGCASLPETIGAHRVEPGETVPLKQGEILVFGRILFVENGKSKMPYGLGKPYWQLMSPKGKAGIGQSEKRKILPFLSTREDGVFVYVIPAGRYEMSYVEPFGYIPMIDPAIEFDAAEPGQAYYLGDLEVDIDASIWLGGLWGNYITRLNSLEVKDRFDETRELAAGIVTDSDSPRKALLIPIQGRSPQMKEQFIPPVIHR